ncbi:MAG: hypothetical protein FWE61_09860 [Micrococcales bacterium]|nr:hypothetical protein [Micrococcales bacterium]
MSRARTTPITPDRRERALVSRLLWTAGVAPFVVALVWVAWPMVAAGLAVRAATHQAHAGDRPGYFWLDAVADHGFVEQWRAEYNRGTVRLLAGEGWDAVEPLRRALDAVPQVQSDGYVQYCMVLDNLVLAYEAAAAHAGDPDEARHATADAVQLRKDPRCTTADNTPPPGPAPPHPHPDGPDGSGDDADESQRQRELDERRRGSDADAEQFRQGGGTPDLTNPGSGRPGGERPPGPGPQDW